MINPEHCSVCGRRYPAKRLTWLGPARLLCARCLDHIPSPERRSLLRRARQEVDA